MIKFDSHLAKILAIKPQKIACLIYSSCPKSLEQALSLAGITVTGRFPFIDALSVVGETEKIQAILKHNCVEFATLNSQVFALMNVANKILGTLNVSPHFEGTISYIDTGIHPHLDFTLGQKRIVKFIDLINHRLFPYDDNGHGTFVAGVGSGNGLLSAGKFSGVCPNSKIVSIKALDASGEANATKILEAMQWVYDNHKKFDIKIVCMSFGSEPLGNNDPIMKGAEKLWDEGIIVVSAAGNSGPEYQTIKSPGISPKIITVGGFNDNRLNQNEFMPELFEIAEFSSRGPALEKFKPDVVAPSVDITSCGIDKPYTTLSGTSVATPMIAGLCGLLLAKKPSLSPSEIKQKLISLAKPISLNPNQEGYGYVSLENT